MKSLSQFLFEAKRGYTAYHNTDKTSFDNIMSNGFKLDSKVKRKKLFGGGIYFSEDPNPRWGSNQIEVILKPRNPLIDPSGNIIYEDNDLGKAIQELGNKLYSNFRMTNNSQVADAIETYLKKNNHDMLLTEEHDKTIFVVRDPKIIEII